MLLSMLLDEDQDPDEGYISALFQVGEHVLQLKQKPQEGRLYDKDKEDRQEAAMAQQPDATAAAPAAPATKGGGEAEEYDSAFPNVGLVVWQAGFVLGEYLLRTAPLGPWKQGQRVLELGCGTGQLGIVLALAGAAVTLTDLAHIVPLTQVNVGLNAARCSIQPLCAAYMWGTPVHAIPEQQQRLEQQQQPEQATAVDCVVAADVLYEPQHYDELLDSLVQLCPSPAAPAAAGSQPSHDQQQEQQQQPSSPPVFICYRVRVYDEGRFEAKAAQRGFEVSHVPTEQLHKDYQCGGYRLMRLQRL